MRIHNPKTNEWIENKFCRGCYCHEFPAQFGELSNGCCSECGCPKNEEGFEYFKEQYGLTAEENTAGQKYAPGQIHHDEEFGPIKVG